MTLADGKVLLLYVHAEPPDETRSGALKLTFWRDRRRTTADRPGSGAQQASEAGLSSPASGPDPLTPREMEVLHLLTRGLSTVEMAENLGIRENTVRNHVARVLGKLGASSRVEAVAITLRRGFS